jgi:hypothetical protein
MPLLPYKAIADEVSRIEDTDALVNKNYAVGANILYQRNTVVGPVGHLATFEGRNCLLASIGDCKDGHTHKQQGSFLHNMSLGFSFPSLPAFPIERPAIWHAFVPSTLPRMH